MTAVMAVLTVLIPSSGVDGIDIGIGIVLGVVGLCVLVGLLFLPFAAVAAVRDAQWKRQQAQSDAQWAAYKREHYVTCPSCEGHNSAGCTLCRGWGEVMRYEADRFWNRPDPVKWLEQKAVEDRARGWRKP